MGGISSSITRNPSDAATVHSSSSTSSLYPDPLNPQQSPISPYPMSTPDSNSSKPDPDSPQNQTPTQQTDPPIDAKPEDASSDQVEQEDEEEGECGFCLFMKAGGCRDSFIDWENCIEEAEKNKEDVVDKCVQATATLKKCMEAHADYYEPILRAEKAAEQQFVSELDKEAVADQNADKNISQEKEGPKDSGKEVASNEK